MSAFKHEETDNFRETLVDTIKTNLVYQFKIRIDETNTEVVVINGSNIDQYEKLNKILVNIRRLDPSWSINSNSNRLNSDIIAEETNFDDQNHSQGKL